MFPFLHQHHVITSNHIYLILRTYFIHPSLCLRNFFFSDPIAKNIFKSDPLWEKKFQNDPLLFLDFFFFLSFSPFPSFQMAGMSFCPTRVQPSQADVIGRFFFNFFFRSRRLEWRDWLFFFFCTTYIYN